MEEFTNKNDVKLEEDGILSAEKKITLEPLHDDVHVDDESDVQVAASHANGAPIANISSDRESTTLDDTQPVPVVPTAAIMPKPAAKATKPRVSYQSIVIMSIIVIALLFALLYR